MRTASFASRRASVHAAKVGRKGLVQLFTLLGPLGRSFEPAAMYSDNQRVRSELSPYGGMCHLPPTTRAAVEAPDSHFRCDRGARGVSEGSNLTLMYFALRPNYSLLLEQ